MNHLCDKELYDIKLARELYGDSMTLLDQYRYRIFESKYKHNNILCEDWMYLNSRPDGLYKDYLQRVNGRKFNNDFHNGVIYLNYRKI